MMTAPSEMATEVAAEVARMLTEAIAAYHRDQAGSRVFSLAEAAERLHMSERALTVGCRKGQITHTRIGKFRGLTNTQIELYAARNEVRSGVVSHSDELGAAIALTRQSGGRRRGRAA